jgi:hypothetical protein
LVHPAGIDFGDSLTSSCCGPKERSNSVAKSLI